MYEEFEEEEFFGKRKSPMKRHMRKSRSPMKRHMRKSRDMCKKHNGMEWVKKSKHAKGYCRKSKSRSRSRK
jgi:hypothetical protein